MIPGMQYIAVNSTHLAAVAYDEHTSRLVIRFHKGGEFEYAAVPLQIYRDLLRADSIGRYFTEHIKNGGYRCRKLQ